MVDHIKIEGNVALVTKDFANLWTAFFENRRGYKTLYKAAL